MTETFDASWLELREPVDHRSRAAETIAPLVEWWTRRRGTSVLDLGCGTGSNLRYLSTKLPGAQRWTMVDHDAELLERVRAPAASVEVRCVQGNLADEGVTHVARADLVTASALLDLVSEEWLGSLADACARVRCGALFALTYDGTIEWQGQGDALDEVVRRAVNEHQTRDKGLGTALGPSAANVADQMFRARGYRTWLLSSPWSLGPGDFALTRPLIDGWADAVVEIRPHETRGVRSWQEVRRAAADNPNFGLVVGHLDLLALP